MCREIIVHEERMCMCSDPSLYVVVPVCFTAFICIAAFVCIAVFACISLCLSLCVFPNHLALYVAVSLMSSLDREAALQLFS